MKTLKPLLFLLLFIFCFTNAALSQTEGFFAAMNKVISDYPNNFKNITGKPEQGYMGRYFYASLIEVPGAKKCYITDLDWWGPQFGADFHPTSFDQALKDYEALTDTFANASLAVPFFRGEHLKKRGQQAERFYIFNCTSDDSLYADMMVVMMLNKFGDDPSDPSNNLYYVRIQVFGFDMYEYEITSDYYGGAYDSTYVTDYYGEEDTAQVAALQEEPVPGNASFEFKEVEHDFGVISEDSIVEYTFTFTNTGTEPLIISEARGSCGCTVPEYSIEPIPVGGTGEILVSFNPKGKSGIQRKSVFITANTNPARTTLNITAAVKMVEQD